MILLAKMDFRGQGVVNNQEKEISHLKLEIDELKGQNAMKEQRIAALETKNFDMEAQVNELKEKTISGILCYKP